MISTIPLTREQRVTNSLLLNSSFIDNYGLMHGKMGIAIYFYHLARKVGNRVYEDYAGELIDEIYNEIHAETPCNFEDGLAGIGWGIEYLVQKKFIDADTNEVLEEFDNRILQEVTFSTLTDFGVCDGIGGYILYFLGRMNSCKLTNSNYQAIKKALADLVNMFHAYLQTSEGSLIHEEPDEFDLTWKYTQAIWLLNEISGVLPEVDKPNKHLIIRLLSPCLEGNLKPQKQSHCLLLAAICETLKGAGIDDLSSVSLESLEAKLLGSIDRTTIQSELSDNSVFIKDGTSGIAFLYDQLFQLTQESAFKNESEFWKLRGYHFPESNQSPAGFYVDEKNQKKAFGILNGLAGINLL